MYDNAVAWMIGFANDRAIEEDAGARSPRPTRRPAARSGRPSRIAGFANRIVGVVRPERAGTTAACCAA